VNLLFRNIFAAFLLFAFTGTILLCIFTGVMQTSHAMQSMPTDHNAFADHFIHTKELTTAKAVTTFMPLIVAFLTAIFTIPAFFFKDHPSQRASLIYFRKNRHDISRIAQQATSRWFSLLENSPSFIQPA
jgi:ABC-type multidrug transport system fused ATPase/permease subunit